MSGPNVNIYHYLRYRDYLAALFESMKAGGKRFGYEKFAEQLGFGRSSYLFQVIRGDRNMTPKSLQKLAQHLKLGARETRYLEALVRYDSPKDAPEKQQALSEIIAIRYKTLGSSLDQGMLEYLSEWYHPVVRELVLFDDFTPDPTWIAQRIKPAIKPKEAEHSFALLQRLGMIEFDAGAKRWRQSESHVGLPESIASLGLLKFHQDIIERAREALSLFGHEQREISSLSLTVTIAEFQEIKKKLIRFRKDIRDTYGASDKIDKVVQLNLQLFPTAEK